MLQFSCESLPCGRNFVLVNHRSDYSSVIPSGQTPGKPMPANIRIFRRLK